MLLSPTCSGMNSTQPRSPQVCIRGAKCAPETHTNRQRWGWECGGAEWSDLGRGRAPWTLCYFHGRWVPLLGPCPLPYNHQRCPAPQAHPESDAGGGGASPAQRSVPTRVPTTQVDATAHVWGPERGAREVGTRAGVLASRVRPEVETKTRSRHPPLYEAGRKGVGGRGQPRTLYGSGEGRAERQGGRANKGGRLCLGTKGSPSHNDCAAAVGDDRRRDPSRSRKKGPSPVPPSPGRVGGVSDPEIHQRKGFPPRDTPHPTGRQTRRDWGLRTTPKVSKATRCRLDWERAGCWRRPAPPGSLGRAPGVQLVSGLTWEQLRSSQPTPTLRGTQKSATLREAQPQPTLPGPTDGRKLGPQKRSWA